MEMAVLNRRLSTIGHVILDSSQPTGAELVAEKGWRSRETTTTSRKSQRRDNHFPRMVGETRVD